MRLRFLCVLFLVTLTEIKCSDYDEEQHQEKESETGSTPDADFIDDSEIIERTIQSIEQTASVAGRLNKDQTLTEDTELLRNEIIETFEDLAEVLKEENHANKFLKANGISRIIMPFMDVDNAKLKELVLTVLKSLIYEFPLTTEVIPIFAIDKLLDTFEDDDNLAMKAHALDILYKWLPENPKAQVRVMKLKGLEPFYNQMAKLDTSVISTLLDLFNIILNEHVKVRDRKVASKLDSDKLILYRRIGLIERMSTPPVCNGLMNIFEATLSYSNDNNDVIAPVVELIKNMKPFCVNVLKDKNKAVTLFEAFIKYIGDESKKDYFDSLEMNVTDTKLVLEDFLKELKRPVKDEL